MPWDPSFVLVAWRDEAQWLVMGDEQAIAIVVVKGPSGKQGLSRSWTEQDEGVSFAASRPRGD